MEEETIYFDTTYILNVTGKPYRQIIKWAKNNNVLYDPDNFHHYRWTQKNIMDYFEYLKDDGPGPRPNKELPETDNLDTLYHRLYRSKKMGNTALYNQTRELIDKVKNKKSEE